VVRRNLDRVAFEAYTSPVQGKEIRIAKTPLCFP
jgi:hypothetical protein